MTPRAARLPSTASATRRRLEPQRQLGAPGGRIARRDDSTASPSSRPCQIAGQARPTARAAPASRPRRRSPARRPAAPARGPGAVEAFQPAAPSAGTNALVHREPSVGVGAPPAGQARQRRVAVPRRSWTKIAPIEPGPAVEVLVGAPGGHVDVPVVERQLHVAGRVGQVPADERAGRCPAAVSRSMSWSWPVAKLTPARKTSASSRACSRDGGLQVVGRRVASPVRGSTTTRSASPDPARATRGGSSARAGRTGRAGRRRGSAADGRTAGRTTSAAGGG